MKIAFASGLMNNSGLLQQVIQDISADRISLKMSMLFNSVTINVISRLANSISSRRNGRIGTNR